MILVGNGQSLAGQGLGEEIDSHDVVVKVNPRGINAAAYPDEKPKDYGSRMDVLCAGLGPRILEFLTPDLKEVWVKPRANHIKTRNGSVIINHKDLYRDFNSIKEAVPGVIVRCPMAAYTEWINRYLEKIPGKGKRPSTGFYAILSALEELKPQRIALAGFDAVRSGAWWDTRYNKAPTYTKHYWKAERDTVREMSENYKCGIDFIGN